jgi:hypothetical protein
MLTIHGFIEHACLVTPEAGYLLLQPNADLRHQVLVTLTPQLVSMSERTWHTPARRLDDMFPHRFGIERRQFVVPVDYPAPFGIRIEFGVSRQ